jgi:C-terminal processing protease CtpA/Prc
MKTIKDVLICLLVLILTGCTVIRDDYQTPAPKVKQKELFETISVKKLHKDMDYFLKVMEEVHVVPYLIISKEDFYKEFNKVKSEITEPLTRKEFYQKMAPLIHSIKASHTSVRFPPEIIAEYKKNGGTFFPMDVEIDFDKRIYVKNDYSENHLDFGTEILSINGINSVDLVNRLLKFEKGSAEKSNIKRVQSKVKDLLWQVYDFEGSFMVETKKMNLSITGMTWNEIEQRKKQMETSKIEKKSNNKTLQYNALSPETGLLTIKQFWMWNEADFNDTIRKCFQQIQEDKITNLIIDVRGNQGGSDGRGEELCQYIADKPYRLYSLLLRKKSRRFNRELQKSMFKPWTHWFLTIQTATWFNKEMKIDYGRYVKLPYGTVDTIQISFIQPREEPLSFNGNTYVLMDEFCYSGTLGFLAPVKDYKLATIIGTESGESPGGYGEAYEFGLPNSQLFCRVSVNFMVRPNGDPDVTRGILPDYEVRQSFEDTQKNEDTVLKFTLNFIHDRSSKDN